MKHSVDITGLVNEACQSVMADGKVEWRDIKAAIKLKLASLPEADRVRAENQLSLMISLEEDQGHKAVSH